MLTLRVLHLSIPPLTMPAFSTGASRPTALWQSYHESSLARLQALRGRSSLVSPDLTSLHTATWEQLSLSTPTQGGSPVSGEDCASEGYGEIKQASMSSVFGAMRQVYERQAHRCSIWTLEADTARM